ncbi:MAG: SDR family oxidoreductase [Actinomycetota bacterium]|nr:SDR family oxidoreductase [Actinomycetota bacterium]
MKTLVTGGAGFIGSALVRGLLDAGASVTVLDDLSTGKTENLSEIEDEVRIVRGDVRDAELVPQLLEGAEVAYHLAALPSVARSVADPLTTNSVNVDGTLNVLTAARDAGVRRVVFASSSSVYGDTPTLPKHEGMPQSPLSPYAVSKLTGESYCKAFARVYGLETVALRFFNVFGPRQDPNSQYAAVVPRFVTRMLAGESPQVFGDGTQSRDFTFVSNVVGACMGAAEAGAEASGEAMNVGCGDRTTLLDLIGAINSLLGTAIEPEFLEPRQGDVRHSLASIEKAQKLIAYEPAVELSEGLEKVVRWYSERTQPSLTAP